MKKIAIILAGMALLLSCGRVFASLDNVRLDAIASKAEQASEGVRNVQSKIDDLQSKINRLEDKISSRDYRIETLERKVKEQDDLDRRIKALEDAREAGELPTQTRTLAGKTQEQGDAETASRE